MSVIDNSAEIEEMAGELTGTAGMSDAPSPGEMMPNDLASDVEAYEAHQAEQGLPQEAEDDHRREVPLGALKEERARRQQLQQQLAQIAQHNQAMQAQYQQALAQQQAALLAQQQAAAEAQMPTFAEDPQAYIEARERQFQQALEELRQRGDAAEVQARAQEMMSTVTQRSAVLAQQVTGVEQEFIAANPDYPQAFGLVQQDVANQLRAQAPMASPAELEVLQHLAAQDFLMRCAQAGQNPCAVVYQRAVQLGHKAGHRAPSAAAPRAVQQNQMAPTLEAIANMSDDEFSALFENMRRGSLVRPAV